VGLTFLDVAVEAARRAGDLIREKAYQTKQVKQKTSASDLVTEVDQRSEEIIRDIILRHFPDHAILGEEGVAAGDKTVEEVWEESRQHEYVWIVDPIDGTSNFVHGFPFFCVSIALAKNGELITGVVYDPMRDELFTAEKGKGAYLNGQPIRVSGEETLAESLMATGFSYGQRRVEQQLRTLMRTAPRFRSLRNGGAAALHLAYIAAGRLTGYWELGLNPWDLAAGVLLVKEAGGEVTDTWGRPFDLTVRNTLATNGKVHREMVELLRESQADVT
jgi:myo-inositol-1(or 4)-monophosphatase